MRKFSFLREDVTVDQAKLDDVDAKIQQQVVRKNQLRSGDSSNVSVDKQLAMLRQQKAQISGKIAKAPKERPDDKRDEKERRPDEKPDPNEKPDEKLTEVKSTVVPRVPDLQPIGTMEELAKSIRTLLREAPDSMSARAISSIDPELRRSPEPGYALEDLKKAWLPVVDVGAAKDVDEPFETDENIQSKRMRKEELRKDPNFSGDLRDWTPEQIIRALMGSIISLAKKYATSRYPIEDAVVQGILGVYNAMKWDKGMSPFAQFAWKPISSAIRRQSFESDIVKVPEGQYAGEKAIKAKIAEIEAESGPLDDVEKAEIARGMRKGGLFSGTQMLGKEIAGPEGGDPTTAAQMLPAASRSRPIVRPGELKPGEERVVYTSKEAPSNLQNDMLRMMHNKELFNKVMDLAKFTPDERQTVVLSLGLEGNKEHQLKDVATIIGKDPRRMSEIRNRALRKLNVAALTAQALGPDNVPESKMIKFNALMEALVMKLEAL